MRRMRWFLVVACLLVAALPLIMPIVLGHEEDSASHSDESSFLRDYTLTILAVMFLISAFFLGCALLCTKKTANKLRMVFFLGIVTPAVVGTIFLVGFTLHTNITSETKGPVHWHADFEVWRCGEKVDLVEPVGFSNRIGTPMFHEHGDNRIHVEGVVRNLSDVNLAGFFDVVGGKLEQNAVRVPTASGVAEMRNGDSCGDDAGTLQVFVYRVDEQQLLEKSDWTFEQIKIMNFTDYVLAPSSQVPPGDCIIIEFGPVKEHTEHSCETYRAALQRGELHGG